MSAFPDTPATLLARLAAQVTGQSDEAAWTRLFELYEPAIRKFAEGHGAGCEGEDANVSMDDAAAGLEPSVDSETAAVIDAKWRLARHAAAVEHALTKTALSQRSKDVYRAYVLEERPIDEVAARFGIPNNSVSQIKTRVEKMIAAVEAEYGVEW